MLNFQQFPQSPMKNAAPRNMRKHQHVAVSFTGSIVPPPGNVMKVQFHRFVDLYFAYSLWPNILFDLQTNQSNTFFFKWSTQLFLMLRTWWKNIFLYFSFPKWLLSCSTKYRQLLDAHITSPSTNYLQNILKIMYIAGHLIIAML